MSHSCMRACPPHAFRSDDKQSGDVSVPNDFPQFTCTRTIDRAHPGRKCVEMIDAPRDQNTDPFFIVGCSRSGTTLLQVLIDAHPRLAVPPESHIYDRFGPFLNLY